MPRLHGIRETYRLNVYDAFRLGQEGVGPVGITSGYVRLFGNLNLGRDAYCNLHVPGHIAVDQTATIEHWYARTDLVPDLLPAIVRADFARFAATTVVTMRIGDKPSWRRSLAELLAERPWEPTSVTETRDPAEVAAMRARVEQRRAEGVVSVIVHVRQHLTVEVVAFQGQVLALERSLGGPATFWVHLEGIATRDVG